MASTVSYYLLTQQYFSIDLHENLGSFYPSSVDASFSFSATIPVSHGTVESQSRARN